MAGTTQSGLTSFDSSQCTCPFRLGNPPSLPTKGQGPSHLSFTFESHPLSYPETSFLVRIRSPSHSPVSDSSVLWKVQSVLEHKPYMALKETKVLCARGRTIQMTRPIPTLGLRGAPVEYLIKPAMNSSAIVAFAFVIASQGSMFHLTCSLLRFQPQHAVRTRFTTCHHPTLQVCQAMTFILALLYQSPPPFKLWIERRAASLRSERPILVETPVLTFDAIRHTPSMEIETVCPHSSFNFCVH